MFLQTRRDGNAAKRFFNRLLIVHGGEPGKIVTDKLGSYAVAHQKLAPDSIHDTSRHANNRAELSHQPTRVRERGAVNERNRLLAVARHCPNRSHVNVVKALEEAPEAFLGVLECANFGKLIVKAT